MCGIIGYSGPLDASKILLDGLSGLEYRGYDSAGIGLCMEDTSICIAKKVGKVKNLREYCAANICVTAKAPPDISAISALTAVKHGNCSSLTPLLNPVRTRKSLI